MLGFDALGRLALGQVPNPAPSASFASWSAPGKAVGLAAAVVATTFVGFVPPPPAAAKPVFTSFSQPQPAIRVAAHQQPQPSFEVTRVILAVTPAPLVFTRFSEPAISRAYRPEQYPPVAFQMPPPAAPLAVNFSGFADFSIPPKPLRSWHYGFTNTPQPTVVQSHVFARFAEPPRIKSAPDGFTNAPLPASIQNYVFSRFEQPQFRRALQLDPPVQFANLPVVAAFVQPYVFGPFDQPRFKTAAQFDPPVQFQALPPPPFVYVQPPFNGFLSFDISPQMNRTMPKGLTAEGVAMTVIFTPNIDTSGPDDWITRARRRGRR